eukprot:97709_1
MHINWFDTELVDNPVCNYVYQHPFTHALIPRIDEVGISILVVAILNVLILTGLLTLLWCKRISYVLLPFYNMLLIWYTVTVTIGTTLNFGVYFLPDWEGHIHDDSPSLFAVIPRAIVIGLIIGIQVLVLLIIVQIENISPAVKNKCILLALVVFAIICALEIGQHFVGYVNKNLFIYCLLNLFVVGVPAIIYIFALCWVYGLKKDEYGRKQQQQRQKMIWRYCILMLTMLLGTIIANGLMVSGIEGYCFDAWTQYLFRLFYPFLFWYVTYKDNQIWEKLVDSIFDGAAVKQEKQLSNLIGITRSPNDNMIDESLLHEDMSEFLSVASNKYDTSRKLVMPDHAQFSGSTAAVKICKLKNKSKSVVVKQLHYTGNKENDKNIWSQEEVVTNLTRYMKEVLIVRNLKHKNIVAFKGWDYKLNRFGDNVFYLVYEYCNEGDLVTFLKLEKQLQSNSVANYNNDIDDEKYDKITLHRQLRIRIRILLDVCRAMRELHGKYIVHRDLKPGNVLIHCDDEKAQKYTSELCDF